MEDDQNSRPLLVNRHERSLSDARISELSSGQIEEVLERKPLGVRWWIRVSVWESRLLWILSWASIVVSEFNYMLTFLTLMFCGHLSALELAGASVASVGIQGLAYGIMVSGCF